MDKDTKKLLRNLERQGWTIEATKSGHIRAIPPDTTKPIVIIASTPSDHRAWKNTIAQLRKSGADI
ncbi:MAG TPA: hypothetical protein VH914_00515 [Acidimicrobiia bacterium]|jgi:predicted RNA binding protein YcfA (HicA-like mRNA interferase family)|nr:hypothetical protein [Acidimicrobiia bacterium]